MAKGFFRGLVFGGAIGAALGILYAPRPGAESRRILKERGEEFLSKSDEWAAVASRGLREVKEKGRAFLKEAIEEGKEASSQKKVELSETLEKARGTKAAPSEERG